MGIAGTCLVTPTHQRCLLEHYRRLLGEVQFLAKEGRPEWAEAQAKLDALGGALRLCAPEVSLDALKPIRQARPTLLPGSALTRLLLRTLRLAGTVLSTVQLTEAILLSQGLMLDARARSALSNRIAHQANTLGKRGIVQRHDAPDGPGWSV